MPYGNVRGRLTPSLGALIGTTAAAKGIGKTNSKTINSGLGEAGAKLKTKAVNPLMAQQQDIAMAQALGLKGAKGAKPSSLGRQNQPVVKAKEGQTVASKVRVPKIKPVTGPAAEPRIAGSAIPGAKRAKRGGRA